MFRIIGGCWDVKGCSATLVDDCDQPDMVLLRLWSKRWIGGTVASGGSNQRKRHRLVCTVTID